LTDFSEELATKRVSFGSRLGDLPEKQTVVAEYRPFRTVTSSFNGARRSDYR
jgi:hypothetical protein